MISRFSGCALRPALGAFLRDIGGKIAGIPQCRALGTTLRSHTVMEFDHEIISQVAIIVFHKFSSEILVYRPGSNPLCGLNGGAMANNKLFTIWYTQQHCSK